MGFREEYKEFQRDLDKIKARREVYDESRATTTLRIAKLDELIEVESAELNVLRESHKALQKVLGAINDNGREGMEDTINKALKVAVPKRNYQVSITDYEHARNGWCTDISFVSSQMGKDLDPRHQSGEAAKQTLSVSLIFSYIAFAGRTHFIFFDESFGGVYGNNTRNIGKVIQTLASINKFQVFLINQDPSMFDVPGMRIIELDLADTEEGLKVVNDYIVENETGDIEEIEAVGII